MGKGAPHAPPNERPVTGEELGRAFGGLAAQLHDEQGHRTPLLDQAAKLAKALGCSLDDLAPEVEIPGPKKGKGK